MSNQVNVDYSISLIRVIALSLIVICHIFQELGSPLAEWFNVGVQIFLVISGYLYGKKQISEIVPFYVSRIKKLLVPYYIVVGFTAVATFLFARDSFDIKHIISCLAVRGVFGGVEHLWFIPVIFMCYLLTPLFQKILSETFNGSVLKSGLVVLLIIQILSVVFILFAPYYNASCIVCYFIGYVFGFSEKTDQAKKDHHIMLFAVLALQNCMQIIATSKLNLEGQAILSNAFGHWCKYNHVWLGIFLFLSVKKLISSVDFEQTPILKKILKITDKYSMEVYFVHQGLIIGPLSLMHITSFLALNIIIIIAMIMIGALLLKYAENKAQTVICRERR